MTANEQIAASLAEHYGLRYHFLARAVAFKRAVSTALMVVTEDELLTLVEEGGGLSGARNPYAVLIGRIGRIPEDLREERIALDDLSEAHRWRKVAGAVRRGETLRTLVARGDIECEEAARVVTAEFAEPDLLELAAAALEGPCS